MAALHVPGQREATVGVVCGSAAGVSGREGGAGPIAARSRPAACLALSDVAPGPREVTA